MLDGFRFVWFYFTLKFESVPASLADWRQRGFVAQFLSLYHWTKRWPLNCTVAASTFTHLPFEKVSQSRRRAAKRCKTKKSQCKNPRPAEGYITGPYSRRDDSSFHLTPATCAAAQAWQRRNAAYLPVQHLHLKYATFARLEFDSTKWSYF